MEIFHTRVKLIKKKN
jgi:hypothetical protein